MTITGNLSKLFGSAEPAIWLFTGNGKRHEKAHGFGHGLGGGALEGLQLFFEPRDPTRLAPSMRFCAPLAEPINFIVAFVATIVHHDSNASALSSRTDERIQRTDFIWIELGAVR